VHRCLPPYRVFLVDRHARDVARGGLVAFHARGLAPYFADGTVVIKALAGLPGDRVEVTAERVWVNGVVRAEGLALARTLGKRPEDFVRAETVPPGHLWVLGASPDSFDARYWGMLPEAQVVGRAYALF
jgi:conjugal transfer pilin signal peptidase TrbI